MSTDMAALIASYTGHPNKKAYREAKGFFKHKILCMTHEICIFMIA
ncbi:hypothetical protein J40TS1_53400 [Paenibacillus montaniterrae]|uniref:Uncharacterized protein n=1 Tax=Paenibacillus montaniterrae TaxID=429341 RepID=A0A919YZR4_9BACL|nr:hypothetical protein J40TS1_53400 [Paenibacillus montaniterrae]